MVRRVFFGEFSVKYQVSEGHQLVGLCGGIRKLSDEYLIRALVKLRRLYLRCLRIPRHLTLIRVVSCLPVGLQQ